MRYPVWQERRVGVLETWQELEDPSVASIQAAHAPRVFQILDSGYHHRHHYQHVSRCRNGNCDCRQRSRRGGESEPELQPLCRAVALCREGISDGLIPGRPKNGGTSMCTMKDFVRKQDGVI